MEERLDLSGTSDKKQNLVKEGKLFLPTAPCSQPFRELKSDRSVTERYYSGKYLTPDDTHHVVNEDWV